MAQQNTQLSVDREMKTVSVAVEGCCHGQLNKIYASLPKLAELLIICGDFQAIRNQQDLKSMNVPSKYLEMGDFKDYYLGRKKAPVLTIFIGGNHELSLYMRELQYGGWVAPGIYYLGEYGTIWYKGIRILGLSGIFSHPSFINAKSNNPPSYTLPYNNSTIRSIYHIKPKNFLKLLLSGSSQIMLSHDWPKGIWEFGNKAKLLKKKPFLKADMESGRLGSPLATEAMNHLQPANWFSLHMHTFFEATVKHEGLEKKTKESEKESKETKRRKVEAMTKGDENEINLDMGATPKDKNEISLDMDDMDATPKDRNEITLDMNEMDEKPKDKNEINLDMDDMDGFSEPAKDKTTVNENDILVDTVEEISEEDSDGNISDGSVSKKEKKKTNKKLKTKETLTYFMALDKCLPRREFLAVKSIKASLKHPSFKSNSLYYDARGIAIQKVVEKFVRSPNWASVNVHDMLEPSRIADLLAELEEMVKYETSKISGNLKVPLDFKQSAPDVKVQVVPLKYWPNEQTKNYCEKWGVPEPDLEGH